MNVLVFSLYCFYRPVDRREFDHYDSYQCVKIAFAYNILALLFLNFLFAHPQLKAYAARSGAIMATSIPSRKNTTWTRRSCWRWMPSVKITPEPQSMDGKDKGWEKIITKTTRNLKASIQNSAYHVASPYAQD